MASLLKATSGQQIEPTFTKLNIIGGGTVTNNDATSGALVVTGDINVSGKIVINDTTILGSSGDTAFSDIQVTDGNQQDGYVLTSDASGNANWKPKLWDTNDTPELASGPSDNNIFTNYNVGIGTGSPTELLHVSTGTTGTGARIGNLFAGIWVSSTDSTVLSHNDLKDEANSFGIRMQSDGDTIINSKTNIDLSIDNVQAMTVDSSGFVGIATDTPTESLHVNGNAIVEGDLTVNGTLYTTETTVIGVGDPLVELASGNPDDLLDIGFYGSYQNMGVTNYTGIARDATDGVYKFFVDATSKPTTTVNFASGELGSLAVDSLQVDTQIMGTTSNLEFAHLGLDFSVSGSKNIFFDTSGQIGVGVTSPQADVHVANSIIASNLLIGTSSTTYAVDITGDINSTGDYRVNGTSVLNGTTLGSGVVNSSLTSVGTLTSLDVTGSVNTATDFQVSNTTVLNGTTLGSGVVNSSLTNVGTLTSLEVSGDLLVDTNTLYVESGTNRIGIGTTDPGYPLDVSGDINTTGNYRVNGTSVLNGTTLGGGVVNSSLTSVGTLSSLAVTGDLVVDTDVLVVDTVDNRVGINQDNPTVALEVVGEIMATDVTVTNNLVVDGDLTVNGSSTTINSTVTTVVDPLIHLADQNISDIVDIGIYGTYVDTGVTKYTGVFRDASDMKFKIFTESEEGPSSNVIDLGATGFTYATLQVDTLEAETVKGLTGGITFVNNSDTVVGSFTNGGFFGIGSTTPTYPLHITKTNAGFATRITNGSSDVYLANASTNGMLLNSGASDANTSYVAHFRNADSANIMYIRNDKTIGILTDTPSNVLDINTTTSNSGMNSGIAFLGNSTTATTAAMCHTSFKSTAGSQALKQLSTGETVLNSATGQSVKVAVNDSTKLEVDSSGNVLIGTASTTGLLNVGGITNLEDDLFVNSNNLVVDTTTGRVGVGITNPSYAVDVVGDINASGEYRIGGTSVLSSTTLGSGVVNSNLTSNTGDLTNTGSLTVTTGLTVDTDTLVVNSGTSRVGIGLTDPTVELDVVGSANISGDLVVGGDITIQGAYIETIAVEDPLIKLGQNNTADLLDLGWYGSYIDTGVTKYSGVFRDVTDNKIHFFVDSEVEPTTTVDTGATGYTEATLVVGAVESSGEITALSFDSTSDRRVKENIEYITDDDILEKVKQLKPSKWNYKNTLDKESYGLIAQDLEEVFPECVSTTERSFNGQHFTDLKSINQNTLTTQLILAVKKLSENLDAANERADRMEALVCRLMMDRMN